MEHPIKSIAKALGIVLSIAFIIYIVPVTIRHFGAAEWQLTIAAAALLLTAALVQVHNNSLKLKHMRKAKAPSHLNDKN